MNLRSICVAPICCLFPFAPVVAGADTTAPEPSKGILPVPDYRGDLATRNRLTGDWGGKRTELANKGIQIDVDWTQYFQNIAAGGRDYTNAYGGHFDYLFRFDLMRMNLVPGGLVTVRAESRYGKSVNGQAGPILPVNTTAYFPLTSELDEGICIAVTNLNYTQFLSEKFALFAGKIDTLSGDANEFASGRGKSQFMNFNFLFSSALALRMPYSTLGAGAVVLPAENLKIAGTVMNTVDSSTTSGFDDFGDGVTATVEVSYQYRAGSLPGGFNVGGLYSYDQDFAQIGGELIFPPGGGVAFTTKDDTWAIYTSLWQYLYVEDAASKPIDVTDGEQDLQGVGVFARLGIADQDTNPLEWSASGGVSAKGLIPNRDHDTMGVGYYYTGVQDTRIGGIVGISNSAQGGECFYNIALTPAARLTLDVQVIDDMFPNTDTAIVLGARLNLRF